MWVETPKGKGKKPVNKDRFISYVFLSSSLSPSLALEVILSSFEIILEILL